MHLHNKTPVPYCVVIPAGGSGQRLQLGLGEDSKYKNIPKQFIKLAGRCVIQYAIEPFLGDKDCQLIVIAVPDSEIDKTRELFDDSRVRLIRGGKTRMQSVLFGLNVLHGEHAGDSWVMVHDAARANLHTSDLEKLKQAVKEESCGGILAVPARDTLKKVESSCVLSTLERQHIWHALTPQMFRLTKLYSALNRASREGFEVSDESSAMEYMGSRVILVEGRVDNIKLTYPDDLLILENLLKKRSS